MFVPAYRLNNLILHINAYGLCALLYDIKVIFNKYEKTWAMKFRVVDCRLAFSKQQVLFKVKCQELTCETV